MEQVNSNHINETQLTADLDEVGKGFNHITPLDKIPFSYVKPSFSFSEDSFEKFDPWGILQDNWTPVYEEFAKYDKRYSTFTSWPKQMRPSREELTQAGFFYSGASDHVYCFHCGKGLHSWEMFENAFVEHKKYSPNCKYMQMICSN